MTKQEIKKRFKTLAEAVAFQLGLKKQWANIRVVSGPFGKENGTYVWEVWN